MQMNLSIDLFIALSAMTSLDGYPEVMPAWRTNLDEDHRVINHCDEIVQNDISSELPYSRLFPEQIHSW